MSIIGADIGHFNSKCSEMVIIESKVSKTTGYTDTFNTKDIITLDGQSYILGEGIADTNYRKIEKINYLTLLYGLLALSTNDKFNEVVVGLPLSQYKEDKLKLKDMILNNREKYLGINGIEKHLVIDDVEVAPEGIYSVAHDYRGLIVDIGGGTTDTCLIEFSSGKRKVINPLSIPVGTIKLYQDFITLIDGKYGLDLLPEDTERLLKYGLKIYGEEKPIKFAMEVFKDYVEKIVSRIQSEYSIKTYDITFIGGGTNLLFNSIRKRIPNAMIVDNPIFSNVIGYKKLGEEIWS